MNDLLLAYKTHITLFLILILIINVQREKIYNFLAVNVVNFIKEIAIKGTHFFIKNLSRFEVYLEKNKKLQNQYKLEDLTPHLTEEQKNEYQNIQLTYLQSLKYGIQNMNVVNIALTGGFGTGKSTLINEFINQNRGYEYIRISLANFNDNEADEKVIETSIIQQIIYFEKKEKLKESSFHRIKHTKWTTKFIFSFAIIIWIYSIFVLFFNKLLFDIPFVEQDFLNFSKEINYYVIMKLIFLIGIFISVYNLFDSIKNFKLTKVNSIDFEVINDKKENLLSVFNRNIEEIIYFFEKTNTGIVIIEDIDRFKQETAQRLFSKIRELSILIKESKNITQPVKFIYAIKDELLTDEKTKFFDLIIPVIPITDYNNSKNIFLKKLSEFFEPEKNENHNDTEIFKTETNNDEQNTNNNLQAKSYLDKDFVSEVAYYVYDMRTITNICNEYRIYHEIQKTNKSKTDQNKLFALLLYKNLFPEDFAKIQKGNSNLHRIFSRGKDSEFTEIIEVNMQKDISNKITKKTAEINQEKELIDSHILKDIIELRKIYLFTIINKIDLKNLNIYSIEECSIKDLVEKEEAFNKLKKSTNQIKYNSDNYYGNKNLGLTFKQIETEINPNLDYNQRENIIIDFHKNKINKLEIENRELIWEKNEINYLDLKGFCENYFDRIESFIYNFYEIKEMTNNNISNTGNEAAINSTDKKENKNLGLILYLIKNGLITEDFPNYLSYFYPGSLTKNDHDFLMKVIENKPTKFTDNIDNVPNLVKEINSLHFKNNNKLINIYVFKFLLIESQNPQKRNSKLNDFLSQIMNFKDESAKFLEIFIKKILLNKNDHILFSNLMVDLVKWQNFWVLVSNKFEDDSLKRKILLLLFQLYNEISNSTIIFLNKQNYITTYINKDAKFLIDVFDKVSIPSLIQTLIDLKIQFEKIENNESIYELIAEVYKNDLYQVNRDNLELFAKFDTKYSFDEVAFNETNYSFLSSQNETYLFNKVSRNLNDYIENVYLKIEDNINENANTIQTLLEKESSILSNKNKIAIIVKGFKSKINSIKNFKEYSVAESLFITNKIVNSWQTILELTDWEEYNLDVIIDFINTTENHKTLSINNLYEKLNDYFDEEKEFYDFTYKLINCEKLKRESFESIFENSMNLKLTTSEIKMDLKFIQSNGKINSLKELRIQHLIEKNYIELNQKEFKYLNENDKKILIKLIEKNEIKFIEDISTYDFEVDLLQYLLYSSISELNKIKIITEKEDLIIDGDNIKSEISERIIDIFISEKLINYSHELFDKLLLICNEEIKKIKFFNFHFKQEDSNDSNIEDALENMGGKFKKIINNEDVTFASNDINREFLNILKKNQSISSFRKQKENLIVNY